MIPVYMAPLSFGLGDLVVSLPALQGLIAEAGERDEQIWLVARSPGQAVLSQRIAGLAGSVDEELFDTGRADTALWISASIPFSGTSWWGSPEFEDAYGPLSINDILARICADLGIPADLTRPAPLRAHPRPEVRDCLLLVTETDGPARRSGTPSTGPRWRRRPRRSAQMFDCSPGIDRARR